MEDKLNIINENDEVIGEATRGEIHRNGLRHREIHVWFITPNKELILQHRAKDKDTYPDLLDATVGGHVEIGDSYKATAIKEVEEETGVLINPQDMKFLRKYAKRSEDKSTGMINNTIRTQFVYVFEGSISDLKIEEGKSLGFEAWPVDKLLSLTDEEKKKFCPGVVSQDLLWALKDMADKIKN
ncbi:MAG TPA: NUDIX domain-containing protein [Candidatus Paceibacterota bacterium]|nr:NUDIX domain-containing protein [Candidatus Paceibacterota bacterium]